MYRFWSKRIVVENKRYYRTLKGENRIWNPLINKIVPSCKSCGTPFHEDKSKPIGFPARLVAKSERKESIKPAKEKQIQDIVNNLDADKRAFLNVQATKRGVDPGDWAKTDPNKVAQIKAEKKEKDKADLAMRICQYCYEERGGHHAHDMARLPADMNRLDELLQQIPKGATLVHVIDALDFPTTVDRRLIEYQKTCSKDKSGRVIWVINKVDLIVTQLNKANKRAFPYFSQMLTNLVDSHNQQVFVVSALTGWNLKPLYGALTEDNYFIGFTNVGKSLLATQLEKKFGDLTMVSDEKTKTVINVVKSVSQGRPVALTKKSADEYKFGNLPVSHTPWKTKSVMLYPLEYAKLVIDMPSIPEPNSVYEILKPKMVKKLSQGRQLLKDPGRYNAARLVAKPNQLLYIGGLVLIQHESSNPRLVTIHWPIIAEVDKKVRLVSSIEKALDITRNVKGIHDDWSYTLPEYATRYDNVLELNFHSAGISLAIRGVGIVHIQANGKIPKEGVKLKVFALPNVRVEPRPNIMHFLKDTSNRALHAENLIETIETF